MATTTSKCMTTFSSPIQSEAVSRGKVTSARGALDFLRFVYPAADGLRSVLTAKVKGSANSRRTYLNIRGRIYHLQSFCSSIVRVVRSRLSLNLEASLKLLIRLPGEQ